MTFLKPFRFWAINVTKWWVTMLFLKLEAFNLCDKWHVTISSGLHYCRDKNVN